MLQKFSQIYQPLASMVKRKWGNLFLSNFIEQLLFVHKKVENQKHMVDLCRKVKCFHLIHLHSCENQLPSCRGTRGKCPRAEIGHNNIMLLVIGPISLFVANHFYFSCQRELWQRKATSGSWNFDLLFFFLCRVDLSGGKSVQNYRGVCRIDNT